MPRDTEETRRRLREAAAEEFAAYGPDGTTMTRIARLAGINKERLYAYFGDKNALFDAVLTDKMAELSQAVAPDGLRFDDLGEFAGRTFDYHVAHPELARLLQWESLRGTPPVNAGARTDHYRHKVDATRQAQQDRLVDARIDPGYLMFTIIGVAAQWSCLPQLATMISGVVPDAEGEHARRRAYVVDAARRLAAPS